MALKKVRRGHLSASAHPLSNRLSALRLQRTATCLRHPLLARIYEAFDFEILSDSHGSLQRRNVVPEGSKASIKFEGTMREKMTFFRLVGVKTKNDKVFMKSPYCVHTTHPRSEMASSGSSNWLHNSATNVKSGGIACTITKVSNGKKSSADIAE